MLDGEIREIREIRDIGDIGDIGEIRERVVLSFKLLNLPILRKKNCRGFRGSLNFRDSPACYCKASEMLMI